MVTNSVNAARSPSTITSTTVESTQVAVCATTNRNRFLSDQGWSAPADDEAGLGPGAGARTGCETPGSRQAEEPP